jgi:hypothetical protein
MAIATIPLGNFEKKFSHPMERSAARNLDLPFCSFPSPDYVTIFSHFSI